MLLKIFPTTWSGLLLLTAMYECLLHILAFMGLSFTTFECLDQEFTTFERLPAQAAFTISNLQSKIAFRFSLLLLLGIYYIWADAWARPVVTKFTIANGISQMHFYKSEYLRQKASNPNILKKKNKQRFWHWEPTKWQLGFRASFWVVVKLSIWIFLEMIFLSVYEQIFWNS